MFTTQDFWFILFLVHIFTNPLHRTIYFCLLFCRGFCKSHTQLHKQNQITVFVSIFQQNKRRNSPGCRISTSRTKKSKWRNIKACRVVAGRVQQNIGWNIPACSIVSLRLWFKKKKCNERKAGEVYHAKKQQKEPRNIKREGSHNLG